MSREEGKSSRELFEIVRVNAFFWYFGFCVGLWASIKGFVAIQRGPVPVSGPSVPLTGPSVIVQLSVSRLVLIA